MKALTICQPYAHLILTGEKRVENRTWPTRYRGPLLIHAGKSLAWLRGEKPSPDMVFGALVGIAELVDCVSLEHLDSEDEQGRGSWVLTHKHTEGPWCWVLENVRRFAEPLPWKGEQGLWHVPDSAVPSNTKINRRLCREQNSDGSN